MAHPVAGPAHAVLLASIARRYYLDGRTKIEIAEEFGLSRFKVARLIDTARDSGLVRIEIRHHGEIDLDVSARLQDRFGLRHAIVVDTPDDHPEFLREHLGRAAADLLSEVVTAEDVLGLAWARSVGAIARARPRLPPIPVVQLTGALSLPDGVDTAVDVVRDVADAAEGRGHFFYAPFTVPDAATARALRQQPEVARAFALVPLVTKAVAGVGQWEPGGSTLHDAVEERDREALRRADVCAELSGVFLSAEGEPVRPALADRMIGISAEQMAAIPEVIAVAYGVAKLRAVRAVLHSGLVGGLVTHTALALALLEDG